MHCALPRLLACLPPSPPARHELRPPEADLIPLDTSAVLTFDPSDVLTLQMFMSELEGGAGEGVDNAMPLSPSPLASPPHPLECTTLNGNGLDDPFLMEFTDLDALLGLHSGVGSALEQDFLCPGTDATLDHDFFASLSECDGASPHALSPTSPAHHFTFDLTSSAGSPASTLDVGSPSDELASPLLSGVAHDHSYAAATADVSILPLDSPRKAALKRPSSADESPPCPKKAKTSKAIVKDNRYFCRRHKNNIASQVSRSKRRGRTSTLFSRVDELETANAQLRLQVEDMTAEAEALRRKLVERLAQ